jgi:hypothetical protein
MKKNRGKIEGKSRGYRAHRSPGAFAVADFGQTPYASVQHAQLATQKIINSLERRGSMGLIVRRDGPHDFDAWCRCDLCGAEYGRLDEAWLGTPPWDSHEGIEVYEAVLAHKRCLDGNARQLWGVPKGVQWRFPDFCARLLRPRAETILEAIERERQKPWNDRLYRRRR